MLLDIEFRPIHRRHPEPFDVYIELFQHAGNGHESTIFIEFRITQERVHALGESTHGAQREGIDLFRHPHRHQWWNQFFPHRGRQTLQWNDLIWHSMGANTGFLAVASRGSSEFMFAL